MKYFLIFNYYTVLLLTCALIHLNECTFAAGKSKITITSPSKKIVPNERVLLSQSHMQFTFDMMSSLIMSEAFNPKTKLLNSILFSPLSIQSILMMIHLGLKGKTKHDLSNVLHLDNFVNNSASFVRTHQIFGEAVKSLLDDEEINKYLHIANQLFINKDLTVTHNYKITLKHYHQATLKQIDPTVNGATEVRYLMVKK